VGTTEQSRLYRGVSSYRDETNESYWEGVLAADETADRVIGKTGGVTWIAPFAPKHHWHIRGIPDFAGVPAGETGLLRDIASGIVNSFRFYDEVGLNSCNVVMYIAEGRRPIVDIIGRSVFDSFYWSDATFFTVLHDESVVDVAPEEYAANARSYF
jgi:galactose-1-phosphate uridylyltransferase